MKIKINKDTLCSILLTGSFVICCSVISAIKDDSYVEKAINNSDDNLMSSEGVIYDGNDYKSIDDLFDLLNKSTFIKNSSDYLIEHYNDIYTYEIRANDFQIELASYAYRELENNHLDKEQYLKELHQLIIDQICTQKIEDGIKSNKYPLLMSTLKDNENLYDKYIILARFVNMVQSMSKDKMSGCEKYYTDDLVKEYEKQYSVNIIM